ncbi:hypothetical protein ACIQV3_22660 [Streptomyces sp. NPDC099050]|uniref:hypothetical protein n=1 Tax=Streptomyces sp. NPDC099050 TaxID=3366100 RepID=UPI00382D0CC1
MRSAQEIADLWERLDDNIRKHGWDSTVDGAARALSWVLQLHPDSDDSMLRRAMERTDVERRRDWIAQGGDPTEWPGTDKPEGAS